MKLRVLIGFLTTLAALAGLALVPAATASLDRPAPGALVPVAGPFGQATTSAGVPVCLAGTWMYAANVGVYVGSCYDAPNLSGLGYEYLPGEQDQSSGPCVRVTGGVDGATDACVDADYWIGPWGPCKVVADGGRGVYSSFCWDGRDATGPPGASVFFNGSNQPCLRIERPTIEAYVDACLTA